MSTETVRKCDVSGVKRGTKQMRLMFGEAMESGIKSDTARRWTCDLAPCVVRRIETTIKRIIGEPDTHEPATDDSVAER